MIGYASGSAGIGVASNDTTTFVTLNLCPGGDSAIPTLPGDTPGSALGYTPIALISLRTSTMKPIDAVVHEVGYGQTLWEISLAYGVSETRIRELNNMAPEDSAIWAEQWLLIVPAGLVTPTPVLVETDHVEATSSTVSSLTLKPICNSPTPTPTPSPSEAVITTPAPTDSSPTKHITIDPILVGLIGQVILGLILVLSSSLKIIRRN